MGTEKPKMLTPEELAEQNRPTEENKKFILANGTEVIADNVNWIGGLGVGDKFIVSKEKLEKYEKNSLKLTDLHRNARELEIVGFTEDEYSILRIDNDEYVLHKDPRKFCDKI